jgi:hypothetical protein
MAASLTQNAVLLELLRNFVPHLNIHLSILYSTLWAQRHQSHFLKEEGQQQNYSEFQFIKCFWF